MNGPGKYDKITTTVMLALEAKAVVLIVIGGPKGNGFEVQTTNSEFGQRLNQVLPAMLRDMADQIEKDNQDSQNERTVNE